MDDDTAMTRFRRELYVVERDQMGGVFHTEQPRIHDGSILIVDYLR